VTNQNLSVVAALTFLAGFFSQVRSSSLRTSGFLEISSAVSVSGINIESQARIYLSATRMSILQTTDD